MSYSEYIHYNIDPAGRTRFYGTYLGTVTKGIDPENRNRVEVKVPQISGEEVLGWALPSNLYSNTIVLPSIGNNVWITFQDGDPSYPLWMSSSGGASVPANHAATHGVAGSDPIAIAQSQVSGLVSDLAGKASTSQTMYLGTTAVAIDRASATGLSLTGVSIDGSSGSTSGNANTVTNGVYTTTTSLPNVTSVNSTAIPASATLLTSGSTSSALTSFGTDPVANTQAVDNNSTKIATTAFVAGQASSATPTMDGTAASGSSLRYSRQDHVHPTDTSRAPYANRAMMPIAKVSSGDWIPMQYTDATPSPAVARTQGREYCQPIAFPYDVTLDRISIYIQTLGTAGAGAGGSFMRLGIRADNNGRPGTLIQDCGAIASQTSSAFVTATLSPTVALTAGVTYWLCAMPTGSPTTGAISRYPGQWLPGTCGSTTQTRQALIGYYQDVTSGSTFGTGLPSSFTRAGDLTLNAGDGFSWAVRVV